ncbi:MAG: class I SAM-dependent methyltransferase [Haloferacaceae archaeon]
MNEEAVRREWAERSGEYSPRYYAHRGADETSVRIRELLERHVGRDARVLEVGCSAGRHLAHLHDHGFEHLTGIEVNGEAFEVMTETYPGLAAAGQFHHDAVEGVLPTLPDDAVDAAFSVETLQHVHPDAGPVFAELARVTADLLVTVENEDGHADGDVNYVDDDLPLYYRDWSAVFEDRGLVEVAAFERDRDTVRAFRQPERTN